MISKALCETLGVEVAVLVIAATMMIHPFITVVIGTALFFDALLFWGI